MNELQDEIDNNRSLNNNNINDNNDNDKYASLLRQQEEEMERWIREQEEADNDFEEDDVNEDDNIHPNENRQDNVNNLAERRQEDAMAAAEAAFIAGLPPVLAADIPYVPTELSSKLRLSYTSLSFGAALGMLWYALRTRQQWYLALVFLGSSKYSYIILGNAIIAFCFSLFRFLTTSFLGGLRLVESEGLGDFVRWNVTETCLALSMFRSDLNVETGIMFLFLVLTKALHWVVQTRESHLRMTQDAVVQVTAGIWSGWPIISPDQIGLQCLIQLLLVTDILVVVGCIQHVVVNGTTVKLLFGFECAIMLVTCMSLTLLWNLHVVDGMLNYWHEKYGYTSWLHAWKDRKATLIFALEVQAQLLKFILYLSFFAIIMTNHGLPINLFREVYSSFHALKARWTAFSKYRKLVRSMSRFPAPPENHEDMTCIICRDAMTVNDSKQLPGCGHVFHSCCLREWLVQQQTCPTCRGDISVTARYTPSASMQPDQEPQTPPSPQESNEEIINDEVNVDVQQQLEPEEGNDSNQGNYLHNSARQLQFNSMNASGPFQSKSTSCKTTVKCQDSLTTHDNNMNKQSLTPSVFPAFYKVKRSPSAPVYHLESPGSCTAFRQIPHGTAVLCLDMELKSITDLLTEEHDKEFGLMLQIAGKGWVLDDHVEFITTVPTTSSFSLK
jgi:E3 ubiquitin-protein ligase synoviolin